MKNRPLFQRSRPDSAAPSVSVWVCLLVAGPAVLGSAQGAGAQSWRGPDLPCGWAVVAPSPQDAGHPEWPRHIAPLAGDCGTAPTANEVRSNTVDEDAHGLAADRDRVRAQGDGEGVRGSQALLSQVLVSPVLISQVMVMTSEAAHSRMQLRVTALESGWPGQVIRCRSSLTGLVFRGRILDAHTVAMLGREGSGLW